MAEPALIATPTSTGATRPENRRPRLASAPRCPAEAPPSQRRAEPAVADDAADYTGFSVVGVAG